jgi:hypothetical protein
MPPAFTLVAPDRLRIREGGGCLSLFGLPFFAAGVLLLLAVFGFVPMGNADRLPAIAWPLLLLMGTAFAAVGGGLAFGRSWTTIDRSNLSLVKQWGLLIPMRERITPLHGYSVVRLTFVEGDSDTADRFPIVLKAGSGPDLPLCVSNAYADARACARAVAEHLRIDVEDASTDHPVRLAASLMDVPFRDRVRRSGAPPAGSEAPSSARIQVTRERGEVRIVVLPRPMRVLTLAAAGVPLAILLVIGRPLATFFRQTRTPDPIAWLFLGFVALFFALPAMAVVNAFLRSRRGATIVVASNHGLRIEERGAWRTRTIASFDGADILDVDYSSRASSLEAARRTAEQQVLESHPSASTTMSPRAERLLDTLTRFARGKGVIVKTRTSLTTFGQGLDEAETRYLHAVVCRALVE